MNRRLIATFVAIGLGLTASVGSGGVANAVDLADGDQLFVIQKGNGGNGNTEKVFSVGFPIDTFAIGTPLGAGVTNNQDIFGATYNVTTGFAYYMRPGTGLIQVDPATGEMTTLGATTPSSFSALECLPDGRCFTMISTSGTYGLASFDIPTLTATAIGTGVGIDTISCAGFKELAFNPVDEIMYVNNVQSTDCRYTVNLGTGVFTGIPDLPSMPGNIPIDAAFDSNGVMWFGAPTSLFSWVPGENTLGGPYPYKLADGTTGINAYLNYIVPAPEPDPTPEVPTLPNTGWSAEQSDAFSAIATALIGFGASALVVMRRRRARV